MSSPDQTQLQKDLIARLRRIEGQVRGVQRMIEEGRDCKQILTQLTAIRNATYQIGLLLARSHATQCLLETDGDAGQAPDIEALIALFSQAAS